MPTRKYDDYFGQVTRPVTGTKSCVNSAKVAQFGGFPSRHCHPSKAALGRIRVQRLRSTGAALLAEHPPGADEPDADREHQRDQDRGAPPRPGWKVDGSVMMRATTNQAATPPAASAKMRGGEADQQIFEREGGNQGPPRGAQRLQDHRVVGAAAVAGGKRAGKHQHRGDQRHAGRRPDRGAELADQPVDDVERILDPDRGDGRKSAGDGVEDRRLRRRRGRPSRSGSPARNAARRQRCWARTP